MTTKINEDTKGRIKGTLLAFFFTVLILSFSFVI